MTKDLQATVGTPLVELLLWRIELERDECLKGCLSGKAGRVR